MSLLSVGELYLVVPDLSSEIKKIKNFELRGCLHSYGYFIWKDYEKETNEVCNSVGTIKPEEPFMVLEQILTGDHIICRIIQEDKIDCVIGYLKFYVDRESDLMKKFWIHQFIDSNCRTIGG